MNIFNFHKMKNYFRNHLRGQICPVSTVGWPLLYGFLVEGWKLDFCKSINRTFLFLILCVLLLWEVLLHKKWRITSHGEGSPIVFPSRNEELRLVGHDLLFMRKCQAPTLCSLNVFFNRGHPISVTRMEIQWVLQQKEGERRGG